MNGPDGDGCRQKVRRSSLAMKMLRRSVSEGIFLVTFGISSRSIIYELYHHRPEETLTMSYTLTFPPGIFR